MCNSILALVLLSPLAFGQPMQADAREAVLVVQLPPDAKLWLNDFASAQTGSQRRFTTPPLQEDASYYYLVRIELVRQGQRLVATKKVSVRPGETSMIEFPEPQPARVEMPKVRAEPKTLALSQLEQAIVDLTNKERQKAGLPPLSPNAALTKAARAHSANMARQGKLDHVLDDKSPADRVRAAGYQGFGWGENIAFGMPTAEAVMETWMSSKGHRGNILNESFNEIGVGVAVDDRGVPFYTQVFGRRGGR
jgi:uncharacterized protein (TIGR03000 family)